MDSAVTVLGDKASFKAPPIAAGGAAERLSTAECDERIDRAETLLTEGIGLAHAGRLSEALTMLLSGLRLIGYDESGQPGAGSCADARTTALASRLLLSAAFPYHELGDPVGAQLVLGGARRVAERAGHLEAKALVHAQHGAMLLRAGELHPAVKELDEAIELIAHAPELDQCKMLLNRAEACGQLGLIERSREDCANARALALAYDLPEFAFYADHNLAWAEFLAGNFARAVRALPSAEQIPNDAYRGIVGNERAYVLLGAGLASEADRVLVDACAALARTDLDHIRAQAELTRAHVALMLGDAELALTLSAEAVQRLRQRSNPRALALGRLIELRAEAAAGIRADKVQQSADRLADELDHLSLSDQAVLARLISADHAPPTRPMQHSSLPRISTHQPLDVRIYGRLIRAKLAAADGDLRRARRHASSGLTEISTHQAQFGSVDLQTASGVYGVDLASLIISQEIEKGRPGAVLSWLERARSIMGRVTQVHPPRDPETAALLTRLRWVSTQLERQDAPVEALRRDRRDLQRRIRERTWSVAGPGSVQTEPGLGELRTALGDATLVAIFHLHADVHAVVLTRQGCWMQRLTTMAEAERLGQRISADLDMLALNQLPPRIREAVRRSLRRDLATIDDLLLAPLNLPETGAMVLAPPGRLAGLAWGILPSLRGRPVVSAPSATAWLRAHRNFDATPGRVVAVAGPGLIRAEDEVAGVAAAWPGCDVRVGAAAAAEPFLRAIDGAHIVHIAAHGSHEPESPLFSAIQLADGPLVAYELERLAVPPQQVVLSACDLGRGSVRPSGEALGLTRALLHAGTTTVISGVARVSDAGAAEAMATYHARLASGSSPAHALAKALVDADDPMPFGCFGAGW